MKARTIASSWKSKPTMEGAGVLLKRAFSHDGVKDLDPFLLLDHFGSDRPEDYRAGFPFHPHRGMETITYLLEGEVEHQDSLGHVGVIGPGDVQWMRAGSGIIHQEMPKGDARNRNSGFQLWANLPATLKMSDWDLGREIAAISPSAPVGRSPRRPGGVSPGALASG
jgi:hypothetical protein